MIKKFSLIIIIYLFFYSSAFANEKIVFIDTNYIFKVSNAGKKFSDSLEKKIKNLNFDLEKYNKEKNDSEKKLLNQKNIISKEEYNKNLSLLEVNVKKYNKSISLKQNEINNFKKEAGIKFSTELQIILEDYSQKNSLLMILKKENVLIGKSSTDITSEILKIFNDKVSNLIKW